MNGQIETTGDVYSPRTGYTTGQGIDYAWDPITCRHGVAITDEELARTPEAKAAFEVLLGMMMNARLNTANCGTEAHRGTYPESLSTPVDNPVHNDERTPSGH